ncbi:arylsulfatase [Pedobacter steynii]|uniref:Arylsulfatase n=1 Tax=Pedobacter steynii TaxID=430522 RepID=A0A1G9ZDL1_9SPHI|nr:arylsulfatase [Pedobacter steynii]NQX40031.1 arylsulfatase [Pedobacter steynii]SDN19472.1 arylsulfatase [Pedobacter steynii]
MKRRIITAWILLGSAFSYSEGYSQNITQQQQAFQGIIGRTLADSKESWTKPVKAPAGSPNVLWILLDDVGFGATSTLGGVINTPTFDSLAHQGLTYTNFHTTAICAPTRSALLTGRNSHSVHMGGFAHVAMSAGFPGYDGRIPSDKGTVAEILRENGYNTFAVGKYGLTPDEDATDAGPFDRWPTGKGFDHFFGFLGSATDQYKPDLVEDNAHVQPDGRHLNEQITDRAISFIERQQKANSGKPFFLYYAPGATHSPHQVATEWSDLYKGKFDKGWDVFRDEVFKRQKQLGIIPANAVLPARNSNIKAWNKLPEAERKLYARFMEIYAGYLSYTDHEVGRVINYLKASKQLENTLVFVIIGDNGASKEGTFSGTIDLPRGATNKLSQQEIIKHNLEASGEIGTPKSIQGNYPLGWAQALNTPFKQWKQDANSEGGTRNPLIVFYPKGIKDKGSIRTQYGHVIDLLPTTLEYTGIKAPEYIRGIKQDSIQGTSLVYSFADAKAASQHRIQHYYIFGARSIYKDGWKAALSYHPDLLDLSNNKEGLPKNYVENVWELYNLNEDFNERIDLAKKNPAKLEELKALFEVQAKKFNLYPYITWDDVYNTRIHKNY